MYGQSGHDQSLIKLVTVNDSRGKDVVLVLANFLKTRWTLDISNKVNLKKIYRDSRLGSCVSSNNTADQINM
jgi:hypothetical protein